MSEWEPLPQGVRWQSRALMTFRISRAAMTTCLGAPSLVDLDSNGLGLFDCWALRFSCGLELALWLFHARLDASLIEDETEPAMIEVHANEPRAKHILFHLPVPPEGLSFWEPSPFLPEPLVWRLIRQDDNGRRFDVARYASRCEALSAVARFEAHHHKQMYWVEEDAGVPVP